ncbi:cobalamin biosynthesis protein CobW [Prauserella marina]|uniref:GTPase, G3E family n=1 Tax=Prauserella marina TaxID=530584 RepID=A0A222VQC1_9PSEU|nr:GTP-binding protein [Prauserella marina]ASR36042.1 cobalamin biosynthesis protein CobW [Prauserella marina]PWV84001.1 G3E family GTPase [Prauserella marina]SDC32757.1 GTPase, G3E family [Prauserella marina]
MTDTHRVPLVLIGGLATEAARLLADRFHAADRHTAVVHHDLRDIAAGFVSRHLRCGPREALTTVALAHGCASCTLRDDLLPLLRELAGRPEVNRIVVRLDEALEPEPICRALGEVLVDGRPVSTDVEVEAVVTAIDVATWLGDATGEDTMAERGCDGDDRTVAQVALAQAEFADILAVSGDATDAWSAAKTGAVLERIAPLAAILELSAIDPLALSGFVSGEAYRGRPRDPHAALLRGAPPLHTDCGVTIVPFASARPFHPHRLHDALEILLDGVVRTRGRAWVAGRPDITLWIESAGGGLGIGHAGGWLDAPEGPAWAEVSPERRTLASLRWHPVFGDRAQELVIVADAADPATITEALEHALLTDEEIAERGTVITGRHKTG